MAPQVATTVVATNPIGPAIPFWSLSIWVLASEWKMIGRRGF